MDVVRFLFYTASSLFSALVDAGGFAVFSRLFQNFFSEFVLTAAAGVSARILSSLLNFLLNKKLVFKSRGSTFKALMRYYALAVPQMAAQILLTQGVYLLFHISDSDGFLRTMIYVIVMSVLYIVSFLIQKFWVFSCEKQHNI